MTALRVPVGCAENRRQNIISRCYIYRLPRGGWSVSLFPEVQSWCKDLGIAFESRVLSYRWGEFTFEDPRHAMLFKLTWL
jgi:hypothetical protein